MELSGPHPNKLREHSEQDNFLQHLEWGINSYPRVSRGELVQAQLCPKPTPACWQQDQHCNRGERKSRDTVSSGLTGRKT